MVALGVIRLEAPAISARQGGPVIFPTPIGGLRQSDAARAQADRENLGRVRRDVGETAIEKTVCPLAAFAARTKLLLQSYPAARLRL